MKRIVWTITVFVALPVVGAFAQGRSYAERLMREGNSLYERGDYQAAVARYQEALEAGYESGALYFNLGNAYYRIGDVGRAILNYERARRLLPDDEEVRFNLELANLRAVDRIVIPPRFILLRWMEDFKNWLGLGALFWLVMGLYAGVAGLLVGIILDRQGKMRRILRTVVWVLAVPLVVFALNLAVRLHEAHQSNEAIVLEDKVAARSGPDQDFSEQFFLHAGAKVRVEEVSGGWCRIRLPDGKVGWLPAATMERI